MNYLYLSLGILLVIVAIAVYLVRKYPSQVSEAENLVRNPGQAVEDAEAAVKSKVSALRGK